MATWQHQFDKGNTSTALLEPAINFEKEYHNSYLLAQSLINMPSVAGREELSNAYFLIPNKKQKRKHNEFAATDELSETNEELEVLR